MADSKITGSGEKRRNCNLGPVPTTGLDVVLTALRGYVEETDDDRIFIFGCDISWSCVRNE